MYCMLKPRVTRPASEIPRPAISKAGSHGGPIPAPRVEITLERALLSSHKCPIAEVGDLSMGHKAEHGFPWRGTGGQGEGERRKNLRIFHPMHFMPMAS